MQLLQSQRPTNGHTGMNSPIRNILEDLLFGPVFLGLLWFLPYLYLKHRGQIRDPRWWGATMPVLLLLLSSDGCYQMFAFPLKQITPPSEKQKVEAIIVASAGVHPSGAPTHTSAIRAHTAGTLFLEGWAPLIVVAGGVTEPYQPPVDVKGIRLILRGMGIPDEAILVETRSANTYENGLEISRLLTERKIRSVLVVSHDYHLYRLLAVLRKQGITAIAYGANRAYPHEPNFWWRHFDWENFNRLQTVAHEYVGILYYKLTQRI